MPGVEEFEGWRNKTCACFVDGGPFDFALILESLEPWGEFVHLVVAVERVFGDTELLSLANHDIDGVMEDAFGEEITQVCHENVGSWESAHCYRQGTNMVVMTMSYSDGIHLDVSQLIKDWKAVVSLLAGIDSGIQQKAMPVDFNKPCACADAIGRIQVCDTHFVFEHLHCISCLTICNRLLSAVCERVWSGFLRHKRNCPGPCGNGVVRWLVVWVGRAL